ncbi:MAG: response regulator [Gemmatimonadetes bacterium]|nr:response regulator [Gemmatimonadota bacterium]
MKILLAEDDPASREALVGLLECEGHEVISVERGDEALAVLADVNPEVLIVDYRLPDINGLDVLSELHAARRLPPAILMSAYVLSDRVRAVAGALAARVLRKPIAVTELLGALPRAGTLSLREVRGRP